MKNLSHSLRLRLRDLSLCVLWVTLQIAAASTVWVAGVVAQQAEVPSPDAGITAVEGIRVGHHTLEGAPTGCTVVLAGEGATAGVDVRGGAPGSRETALLDPVNSVSAVQAVVLSGGSAFGLGVSEGVVRYLEERGLGFETTAGAVPIVVQAVLFDLGVSGTVRPGSDCGYLAAEAATSDSPEEGSVGAGAGATVGKVSGTARAMKGGIGTASITLDDGLTVGAIVAVNAVGDVVDPTTGRVVAGVRTEDGNGLADARTLMRRSRTPGEGGVETDRANLGVNTTIGVVATNANLTKAEVTKVAQMAHDGLARAIYPAHTPWDGDTIFGLATGEYQGEASLSQVGALAAVVVTEAILRAVRQATGLPGFPSVSDLRARN